MREGEREQSRPHQQGTHQPPSTRRPQIKWEWRDQEEWQNEQDSIEEKMHEEVATCRFMFMGILDRVISQERKDTNEELRVVHTDWSHTHGNLFMQVFV